MESSIRPAPSNINPELLAQVTKGDQRAFEELYDQSSSILFTLAARILGNHDEAADLLQEVYLEVWRKAARYDPRRGSPMAWLVTLTRSRAIDRLRSRSAKSPVSVPGETAASTVQANGPSPFEALAIIEVRTLVAQALSELPVAQQKALELAYYEGLSHSEIAVRLNEPIGTIKTRVKLGMHKLKAALEGIRGS
jgi:RNA polymerase sigma-70 factor (ECF subfamily)